MTWTPSSANGSSAGSTRAPTRSTTTTPVRPSTPCACTPTRRARPTRATCATTPSATWWSATRPCRARPCCRPIGFDSFGLPAENAAIRTGTHPRVFTDARIAELKPVAHPAGRRLRLAAGGPQPRPVVHPLEPGHLPPAARGRPGLPGHGPGELVPGVPDGAGQRAGAGRRHLRALRRPGRSSATSSSGSSASPPTPTSCWQALDDLEWPERVKIMQRNWIGRSEGAEFDLAVRSRRTDGRRALPRSSPPGPTPASA